MKLNIWFNELSIGLLSFNTTLESKNSFDLISSDDICKLATKVYNADVLEYKLVHYKLDVI